MSSGTYDLVIIGAGPAGLTAGIYASRIGMKTLIVERVRQVEEPLRPQSLRIPWVSRSCKRRRTRREND